MSAQAIDDNDPRIMYSDDGWMNATIPEAMGSSTHVAYSDGSSNPWAQLSFYGTSLTVHGTFPALDASTVTYTVDTKASVFGNTSLQLSGQLFQDQTLQDGNHTLRISVQSPEYYTLDYISYIPSSRPSSSSQVSSTVTVTATSSAAMSSSPTSKVSSGVRDGIIAVGVLGGIALAALMLAAILLIRARRKSAKWDPEKPSSSSKKNAANIKPFNILARSSVHFHRSPRSPRHVAMQDSVSAADITRALLPQSNSHGSLSDTQRRNSHETSASAMSGIWNTVSRAYRHLPHVPPSGGRYEPVGGGGSGKGARARVPGQTRASTMDSMRVVVDGHVSDPGPRPVPVAGELEGESDVYTFSSPVP